MESSLERAVALVETHGMVPLTQIDGFTCLVDFVAGESVSGSWWGHAKGKQIYAIASALEELDEVLSVKLIGGKVTFVARKMWPALFRVVTDRRRRAALRSNVSLHAHGLLAEIPKRGQLRLDRLPGRLPRDGIMHGKKEIELTLLARVSQMHTERGAHTTVLERWTSWAPREVIAAADRLSLKEALQTLRSACHDKSPIFA